MPTFPQLAQAFYNLVLEGHYDRCSRDGLSHERRQMNSSRDLRLCLISCS